MSKIAGVRFLYSLKLTECLYPENLDISPRDFVVVRGSFGVDIGQVFFVGKNSTKNEEANLEEIIRKATEEDLSKKEELKDTEKEYLLLFFDKVNKYNLRMSPVGVGISLDEQKAVFYYSASGRIDFRELSKDLSRSIKKQAVLRQIGPRDKASIVGGYGRCGLSLCCATFLTDSPGINLEDAEEVYGMPKNVSKISGLCGRLMCCIKFEEKEEKRSTKKK